MRLPGKAEFMAGAASVRLQVLKLCQSANSENPWTQMASLDLS